MRQLLGRANSSNVMKVVWLLEELGVPYVRHDVGGAFGGTDTPEYVAMNFNKVVPTLVEDGFVLWESNVILRYLAGVHAPGTAIWPDDLRARANIDRWMDWLQTTLGPSMTPVFWSLVRTAPEQRDWTKINAAAAQLGVLYGALDALLAKQAYIAGPDFTLADIPIGVHAHRWMSFEIEKPDLPHVRGWYERLLARPAYKAHVAMPMT